MIKERSAGGIAQRSPADCFLKIEFGLILERTFGIICACFSIWIRPLTDCLTGKESKKG
jgi:hypothetical protein